MIWRLLAASLLIGLLVISPAGAVEPDEVLADPVLEARARDLSAQLRCLVCQNQSIDDSDAPLARDLRVLVRERLVAGDNDDQVRHFLVSRYGEFVLLKPRFSAGNLALWLTPLLVLFIGAVLLWRGRRQSVSASAPTGLSDAEEKELAKLLEPRE
ncbi:MAG: cytochrome c-type biogenesis protein [Alphaproteobacteria bacterium]